jgi:hypothetical protein
MYVVCRISGSRDATSLPPSLPPTFPILVNVMCRNIPLVAVVNSSIEDIPVTRYTELLVDLDQRGLNTIRGPRSSSFWVPRNLSLRMDRRQARTGDTVIVVER